MDGVTGLDWGTTRLRACRFDAQGRVVESRARDWGIRQLPEGSFDAALRRITDDWPRQPCIAGGMVGSRQGWHETGYVDTPADARKLADAITRMRAGDGTPIHLIPGLRDPHGPDVMRGEETQLFGALARHPQHASRSTWVLPGTHSKWVNVRDGAVSGFHTVMTGELFALLRRHSILAVAQAPETDTRAFEQGVRTARDSGAAGALSRLFSTRSLLLEGALAPASVEDYLSGLLIGEEWRSMLAGASFDRAGSIRLIGEADLCARYRRAATHFDVETAEPDTEAAAHGLWHMACLAGLVRDPQPHSPRENA